MRFIVLFRHMWHVQPCFKEGRALDKCAELHLKALVLLHLLHSFYFISEERN